VCSSVGKKANGAGGRHQLLQPRGFGGGDISAEWREPIRPSSLVTVVFSCELYDQLVVQETFNQSVQRAGAEAHRAFGPLLYLFENQVAVLGTICESKQNVKRRRCERQERRGVATRRHMACHDMS